MADDGRERCHPQVDPSCWLWPGQTQHRLHVLCNYKVYVYKASCFCETVYFVNKDIATLRSVLGFPVLESAVGLPVTSQIVDLVKLS